MFFLPWNLLRKHVKMDGWKTILSLWGPPSFQVLLLLVSRRVYFGCGTHWSFVGEIGKIQQDQDLIRKAVEDWNLSWKKTPYLPGRCWNSYISKSFLRTHVVDLFAKIKKTWQTVASHLLSHHPICHLLCERCIWKNTCLAFSVTKRSKIYSLKMELVARSLLLGDGPVPKSAHVPKLIDPKMCKSATMAISRILRVNWHSRLEKWMPSGKLT